MTEIGLWHAVRGAQPVRLLEESVPLEKDLENWIFQDPTLISPSLQRVSQQFPLGNKVMDLLAIEEPGVWVVCELKKTPLYRDSLVQAIDYVTRLDLLSLEQLRKQVIGSGQTYPEKTQKLIEKALDRELNGEERNIRVVLAGIGVREDLQHMVDYLSNKFSFPISVCTFAAVSAPGDDQGIILMRDISGDSVSDESESPTSLDYEDRLLGVRQYFKSPLQASIFDELISIFADQDNFYVRPWKKSIMIAPHRHHGRYLAYFSANRDGVRAMVGSDAILEFFPDANVSQLTPEMGDIYISDTNTANEWATKIARSVENVSSDAGQTSNTWNGNDWYFAFGGGEGRRWDDAVEHGFVSAGGGDWYSKTVKNLPTGARVFTYIPQTGYVGVGVTTGAAVNYSESKFWQGKPLKGKYVHDNGEPEYIVPVKWLKTVTPENAVYGDGLFASQHSTCKLRDQRTLRILAERFGVDFIV